MRILNAHLRKATFCRDMNTLLRPDLGQFDVDAAADLVRPRFVGAFFPNFEVRRP
jgi:hypothetical protein